MRFADRIARPTIVSVIEGEAFLQLHKIVPVHTGQAERCREEACRLRREIEACGIRAAHDDGETVQCSLCRPNSSTITSKVQSSPR
jgi:hypothetical protein